MPPRSAARSKPAKSKPTPVKSKPKAHAFRLYKASYSSGKKWNVYVPNPDSNRLKKIQFGARGYEDYTQHHDTDRKRAYIARHINDDINNPLKAGYWAMNTLWNKKSLDDSFASSVRRAKKLGYK